MDAKNRSKSGNANLPAAAGGLHNAIQENGGPGQHLRAWNLYHAGAVPIADSRALAKIWVARNANLPAAAGGLHNAIQENGGPGAATMIAGF
jgi:hypothetical protein